MTAPRTYSPKEEVWAPRFKSVKDPLLCSLQMPVIEMVFLLGLPQPLLFYALLTKLTRLFQISPMFSAHNFADPWGFPEKDMQLKSKNAFMSAEHRLVDRCVIRSLWGIFFWFLQFSRWKRKKDHHLKMMEDFLEVSGKKKKNEIVV